MWQTDVLQFLLAVTLDVLLGDPQGWPHVTRFAGALTTFWEPLCAHMFGRTVFGGIGLWLCVCACVLGFYFLIRSALSTIHPSLTWMWDTAVIYQTLAARDLDRHARNVALPLLLGDIESARRNVGYIVGRDTHDLDALGISRATVEAVAESTTDGFVAPLFWAAIGGAPAALLYRCVNTLDSMVGHRNDAYEKMGKFSAIADDAFNFIPARLCALASLLPRGFQHCASVIHDAGKHVSPNAGWSEASAAWALNVRLGGTNFYDGMPFHGPVFNPTAPDAHPNDISRVLRWFWSVALFCVFLGAAVLYFRDRPEKNQAPLPEFQQALPSGFKSDPVLQRPFIQQQSSPPIKLHGQIKRPDNYGTERSP
jgi:adenosylcobinamide-phosphate synthase